MGIDIDELRRLLEGKRRKPDVFDRMQYRGKPAKTRIVREVRTPDGEPIYTEIREVTVNPYTTEQEHKVVYVTRRCPVCGLPITGEMLATDQIKLCILCGRPTCPRCRANTDIDEWIRPEIRGQPICLECWTKFVVLSLEGLEPWPLPPQPAWRTPP